MSTLSVTGQAWSDACDKGGSGQCDGTIPEGEQHRGMECRCPCHRALDLPLDIDAVKEWHDVFWGVDAD